MKILAVFGLSYISQLHVAPDLSGLGCPPPPSLGAGRDVKGPMGTMPLMSLGAGKDVKGAMGTMPLTYEGMDGTLPHPRGVLPPPWEQAGKSRGPEYNQLTLVYNSV